MASQFGENSPQILPQLVY
ncbi:hypothetical protein AVEN_44504-1, partial [Araneus ventricosus]